MSDDIEEVPPYEEWVVKELREELSARGLNNSGVKADLVKRLYRDDELHPDDDEDHGDAESSEAVINTAQEGGWVEGNVFCREISEQISGDFNQLPSASDHNRMLQETYHIAATTSNRKVIGGPFDGYLASKILIGNQVVYKYCVMLKPG